LITVDSIAFPLAHAIPGIVARVSPLISGGDVAGAAAALEHEGMSPEVARKTVASASGSVGQGPRLLPDRTLERVRHYRLMLWATLRRPPRPEPASSHRSKPAHAKTGDPQSFAAEKWADVNSRLQADVRL